MGRSATSESSAEHGTAPLGNRTSLASWCCAGCVGHRMERRCRQAVVRHTAARYGLSLLAVRWWHHEREARLRGHDEPQMALEDAAEWYRVPMKQPRRALPNAQTAGDPPCHRGNWVRRPQCRR